VKRFNLLGDEWDNQDEHGRFQVRDAWVGDRTGAELLGGSMYEIDPGRTLWPYHFHHANEEWAVVLRGRPMLRTPEGEHQLEEGDVVCFLRGPEGAHQMWNTTDEPVRVLMLSTLLSPEIVEYPDSGKVGATDAKGGRLFRIRPGPTLDYWDGES
jgi:uncharacterized cupin superfamily protein